MFIYSSVNGHLCYFHILAIIINTAIHIHIENFVEIFHRNFNSLGYILRSGITESYYNSIFNFLRNCQLFSTAAASSYVPIRRAWVSDFSTSHPCLHVPFFWGGAVNLMGVKWYLVVLIGISLVTSAAEHIFTCLLVSSLSFLGICLFSSFAHILVGLPSLCLWVVGVLYIFRILTRITYVVCRLFSPTTWVVLGSPDSVLWCTKFLI